MNISIMITTRNRADDLAITLSALRRLDPAPVELLITLDGCTDGSDTVIRNLWPEARVFTNPEGRGSIPSRDHMLREARGDLVLSLDDDSHPLDNDFIAHATIFFEEDERLAVLSFPQRSEEFPPSLTQTDFGFDLRVGSYASSGVVIRVAAYRSLPGYVTTFSHAFEEPDFTLQCLAAGWRTRLHTGLIIRHRFTNANRNEIRTHHLHARNEAWSVLMRCPSPWWPFVLIRRTAGQFAYACKRGPRWVVREPRWWWLALTGIKTIWSQRRPVSWSAYRQWRSLLRNPTPLAP